MRKRNELTATQCLGIKPGQTLHDGGGLMLLAGEAGTRKAGARWVFRFTSPETAKRRDYGLGAFPTVRLAEARAKAEELRRLVAEGTDPIEARRRRQAHNIAATAALAESDRRNAATLEVIARQLHAHLRAGFRNRKHATQWISSLEGHVFPTLGAKPIATITADDLLAVLIPLAERVPETAKRVRERLAAVFADAALRGLCDGNPADLIRRALRRRKASPKHLRALPYVEVPALVSALQEFDRADPPAKLALEFAILTAARSGEVRGATWSEIDLEAAAWTVPATRMKGHRPHFVPLTPRALAILEEVRAYSDGKPTTLVFRGRDLKRPLSDMTLTGILRRMPVTEDGPELWSERTTVHGFRSAFSTWARERTRVRVDVIEAALAHREQDRVAAAYSRADYIRDRRSLAAEWEKFVAGRSSARVIKMPEARPAR